MILTAILLYYYWKNNVFLFTSELRSFHKLNVFEKKIDQDALGLYLQYGFVPRATAHERGIPGDAPDSSFVPSVLLDHLLLLYVPILKNAARGTDCQVVASIAPADARHMLLLTILA
mgnify:CR=1 FL=1